VGKIRKSVAGDLGQKKLKNQEVKDQFEELGKKVSGTVISDVSRGVSPGPAAQLKRELEQTESDLVHNTDTQDEV